MRVLIVKLSAFGDVIHAFPIAGLLKQIQPFLKIDWIVESSFASILRLNPWIDNAIEVDTRKWRRQGLLSFKTLQSIENTFKKLRSKRYDFVLDLQGNTKSGLFTAIARASRKYGFSSNMTRELPNILATDVRFYVKSENIRNQLAELSMLALSDYTRTQPNLEKPIDFRYIGSPVKLRMDSLDRQRKLLEKMGLLPDIPIIGIHMGTTWDTKKWPIYFWMELARRVVDESLARILFFWGTQGEKKDIFRVVNMRPGHFFVWPGGSLEDLASALHFVDLFIGPDTGPLHLAALVGVPTISIYRATKASRNAPIGNNHIALQAPLGCSPCLKKYCNNNNKCATSIPVRVVYGAVKKVFNSRS